MTATSVIEAIKTFIATYTEIAANDPLTVDFLGTTLPGYSIVSLPGGGWVEKWLTGGGTKEYTFAFQSAFSTADEATRLENSGFFEAFATWMDTQTDADNLPVLPAGMTAERIEAVNQGFLYEQGVSDSGIYSINCRLIYDQS